MLGRDTLRRPQPHGPWWDAHPFGKRVDPTQKADNREPETDCRAVIVTDLIAVAPPLRLRWREECLFPAGITDDADGVIEKVGGAPRHDERYDNM